MIIALPMTTLLINYYQKYFIKQKEFPPHSTLNTKH